MAPEPGFQRFDDLLLLKPYSDFLAVCKSKHTQLNYHQDLRVFKHFLDQSGIKKPFDVTPRDLTLFAGTLVQPGLTPTGKPRPAYSTRSLKRVLGTVRSFYRYLAATQQVHSDPTAVFHNLPIRSPHRNPRPLPLSARQSLLQALKTDSLDDLRVTLTVLLGFECGLRVSEIAGLKVRDIHLPEEQITVIGKGDKERTVPMTLETRKKVQRYLQESQNVSKVASPYLFPSPRSPLKPINPHFLEQWVKKAAHWANLENADELTVHVLRHTFGTCLAESGASVYEIRDLMGHSSISVSENYVRLSSQGARDAHKKAFGAGYRGYALELANGVHGYVLRSFRKTNLRGK